jgi:co-chaperonin GroES (HSP10)
MIYKNEDDGINLNTFDIAEELKLFDSYTPNPAHILIRLFVRPTKTNGGIIIDNVNDKYSEIKGYIAKMGACCFEGVVYEKWKDWYKVGDWVVFPRHAGTRFTFKGMSVFSVPDDAPIGRIENPHEVE